MAIPPVRVVIQGVDQFTATIGKSLSGLKRLGSGVKSFGQSMTAGLSLPIIGFGIDATRTAGNFERSMQRVGNVTQANKEQVVQLTKQARELGATTLHSAVQSAEGMIYLGQAGFKTNQIMSALPAVLDIATVSQIELGEASDLASNILTGYGKSTTETGKLVDQLVKTTFNANTNFVQLAEAMSFVAPQASAMQVPFEQASAVIGLLSNAGIQGARAGTNLRAMLASLAKPTSEAIAVLNKLKIPKSQIVDSQGNLKDFRKVIELFGQSGATNGELITIFGRKMTAGFQAILRQGLPAFDQLTNEINNSTGASREAAKAFEDGLLGQIGALVSAFRELQLAMLVDTGLLESITNVASNLTKGLRSLSETNPTILKLVAIFASMLAVVGPVLFIVGQLIIAISAIGGAIASAGGLFALLFNPITLVIGIIVALITVLRMAGVKWSTIWKVMLIPLKPFTELARGVMKNWGRILPFFKLLFAGLKFIFKKFVNIMKPIFEPWLNLLNMILGAVKKVLNFGFGIIEKLTDTFLPDDIKQKIGFKGPSPDNAGSNFISGILGTSKESSPSSKSNDSTMLVRFENLPSGAKVEREKGNFDIEADSGRLLPAFGGY